MRRLTSGFVVCAAILLLFGSSAMAQTQVTIGPSSTGTATFTGSGCPAASCLTVNLGTFTGVADLVIGGVSQTPGHYTLDISSFTVTSGNGGATFTPTSVPATSTFSFTNGTDAFSGTVNVTEIADDTHSPRFVATLTITSCSGTGDFCTSLWPKPSVVSMDFTITLGSNPVLGSLWNNTATTTSGKVSSGEVLPAPEPVSMLLFGSGLLAVGAALRRRKGSAV